MRVLFLSLPLANKLTGRVLDRVKKIRRYSPDDEEEIRDICRQLKVTPDFDQVSLQIYRKLWEVEATGRLEPGPVEADIRLGRNEIWYNYCPSEIVRAECRERMWEYG